MPEGTAQVVEWEAQFLARMRLVVVTFVGQADPDLKRHELSGVDR